MNLVLKKTVNWIYGVVDILGVSMLLMLAVKLYKILHANKTWDNSK